MSRCFLRQRHPFLKGKRRMLGGIYRNQHNYLIEQLGGAADDVEMSRRDRIKAARAYRCFLQEKLLL